MQSPVAEGISTLVEFSMAFAHAVHGQFSSVKKTKARKRSVIMTEN
jgi:hypothetical protein